MASFRLWLEDLESDRERKIRDIWSNAFKALGVGGLADEDAAYQSLSKITFGARSPRGNQGSVFKGKKAAYKRLENGQIFNQLLQLGDPQINKQVEDVKQWLGSNDDSSPAMNSNGDTTVATLMQKMFGQYYPKLIDSDAPIADTKPMKAPPQPPKQDGAINVPPNDSAGPEQPPAQTPPNPMANQQDQPQVQWPSRPMPNQMMPR